MNSAANPSIEPPEAPSMRTIAQVETETALPRATIRMWERRYGFPAPVRDERGERCYPPEQVVQLRLMRQLLDQGHRPARLLEAGPAEIERLAAQAVVERPVARPGAASQLLRLLQAHDPVALRQELQSQLKRVGLARFTGAELPRMNRLVGDAWFRGELQVHEEHLYSDCVVQMLRIAIAALERTVRPEAPRVLLATIPQELHGLGLLMAQAQFALQGCPTVSLGVRLPIEQIVAGAQAHAVDLVGLSFTASVNASHVLRGLDALRRGLPATVRIWAGGSSPALQRRPIRGVRVVVHAQDIPHLLAEEFALPPREMGPA